jgi:signal transduction histidine kinase
MRTGFCYERPGYAFISISDSGVGIKPSEVENVFRPFYSTKPSGAGLGLSLAHRIVEAHNGMIWICHNPCPHLDHRVSKYTKKRDNSREKGTTIHILLPMDGTLKKPVR